MIDAFKIEGLINAIRDTAKRARKESHRPTVFEKGNLCPIRSRNTVQFLLKKDFDYFSRSVLLCYAYGIIVRFIGRQFFKKIAGKSDCLFIQYTFSGISYFTFIQRRPGVLGKRSVGFQIKLRAVFGTIAMERNERTALKERFPIGAGNLFAEYFDLNSLRLVLIAILITFGPLCKSHCCVEFFNVNLICVNSHQHQSVGRTVTVTGKETCEQNCADEKKTGTPRDRRQPPHNGVARLFRAVIGGGFARAVDQIRADVRQRFV
ncbi:MAG: hypothetical protein IK090_08420 [Clostridia bacterium]|nr:hypothetical protein [Clostridia bacterium]